MSAARPAIRNSTLFERKYAINSRESFVSAIAETPLLDGEENFDSLFGRHGTALANIRFIGFLKAVKNGNNLLHTAPFYAEPNLQFCGSSSALRGFFLFE